MLALFVFFLIREGFPTLFNVPISDLLSTRWYPIESYYGILPLLLGSITIHNLEQFLLPYHWDWEQPSIFLKLLPNGMREILKPLV